MWSIKVGSAGDSYYYQIGGYVSALRYANSKSAWRDARRPQRIRPDGKIEPCVEFEEIITGEWSTSAETVLEVRNDDRGYTTGPMAILDR